MDRPRDVEAIITFLPTEHGGRKSPATSDYRPQFYYDCHDWDAAHEYPDVERVHPGDTVRTYLAFATPRNHIGKLKVGSPFLIREGNRVVGFGSITQIIDLPISAERDNRDRDAS